MLVNISNHPSQKWNEKQLSTAQAYGEVVDLPFPQVCPQATPKDIAKIAEETVAEVQNLVSPQNATIHVMGEMNLTYRLVRELTQIGYCCVASTTERITVENPDGSKISVFNFVQFRSYE